MKRVDRWILATLTASLLPAALMSQVADSTGTGWRYTKLDLDVKVDPSQRRLAVAAEIALRLADHAQSRRLILAMNGADTAMAFDSVQVAGGFVVAMNVPVPGRRAMRAAIIDLEPRSRGTALTARVWASSRLSNVGQFTLGEDIALASWVTAWYPIPIPIPGLTLGSVATAPGETRFDLPSGWRAVSNGSPAESRATSGRVLERWNANRPLARSFAAAPYRVVTGTSTGSRVDLYLTSVGNADGQEQAQALAASIAALERRFGPYPTTRYSVAEVPVWVPGFLASSEQGFMMAKPDNFRVQGGNIPLFAHEALHGYWGNLLTTSGPGSGFLSESIAQYGAVIALEAIHGTDAAVQFLRFSREGYIADQSARGYFEVVRRGADTVPISAMTNMNGTNRIVADSKGTWVFHMLRQRLGDDRFFSILRSYLGSHANRSTLPVFRQFVANAAPDAGTAEFFAQWLDRTGAPRFDLAWHQAGDSVAATVTQAQAGAPFVVDLDLVVQGALGESRTHRIRVSDRQHVFRFPAAFMPTAVTLDPKFAILRWDPSYEQR